MAETPDFNRLRQEALADQLADIVPYSEARPMAGLLDETEVLEGPIPTESMYEVRPSVESVSRHMYGRATEPGDNAYELSQSLRSSREVLGEPLPIKGDGFYDARLMADAIGSKNWVRVKELLKVMSQESGGADQDDQVA